MTQTRDSKSDKGAKTALQADVTPELLDVRAVAALLGGCSVRHVYRLADAGKMPRPVKLGSLIRWSRSDLQAWIDSGCPSMRNRRDKK